MTPTVRTLAAVVPGVALVALAETVLDLPRADFIAALDSDRYRILWISGSYLAGSATGMALTTLAASMLGLRRAYLLGLLVFTIAGGLCGWVTEVIGMTPLRFLQGVGAGQVSIPGMGLGWRAFPNHRDRDQDNHSTGVVKAILDALVKLRVIDQDDSDHVHLQPVNIIVRPGERWMKIDVGDNNEADESKEPVYGEGYGDES